MAKKRKGYEWWSMLENIKKKMVKTRKEHECFACLKVIEKSSNAVYITAKQDEQHIRFHLHVDCNIKINKNQLAISRACIKDMPAIEKKCYICMKVIPDGINITDNQTRSLKFCSGPCKEFEEKIPF